MATTELTFHPTEKNKPTLVFFQDEGRFGRINELHKCWVPKKIRAKVGKQIVREYVYAYTAVCPKTGDSFSLIMPYADTDAMSIFLNEFSKKFNNYKIIMIMDKASWHRSKFLQIPSNIKLLFLPAFSPELNPVEHIWNYIKQKFFYNRIFNSMDNLIDKLCIALNYLHTVKNEIISLTLFNWLISYV